MWPTHMCDAFSCVTGLTQMCTVTHALIRMCDETLSHVWHTSSSWSRCCSVRIEVHMCDETHSHVWRDSFVCVTRFTHIYVTRLIPTRDVTHPYVWRDSFTCVTRLIHMRDTPRVCEVASAALKSKFTCVTWLILTLTCDVTHSYMWRDSFKCVTWLIHACDTPRVREVAAAALESTFSHWLFCGAASARSWYIFSKVSVGCIHQHTAHQCNATHYHTHTLQYTAAHCNTVPHTSARSWCTFWKSHSLLHSSIYCNITQCNTLPHTLTHCHTLQTHHTTPARDPETHSQKSQYAAPNNTLHHTATHCHTPPHTATHCHTLQRTTTHYNTPARNPGRLSKASSLLSKLVCKSSFVLARCSVHTVTHCNTLQHTATHCNTL